MKKGILILFILTMMHGFSQAQALELDGTVDVVIGAMDVPEDSELDVHWDVINAGSSALTIRAKRDVIQEVSGSRNRFCWGPLCYDYTTDESSTNTNLMVTMDAGEVESTFHGYYEHQEYAGHTIVEYCFFENGNESNEVCHTVHFCIDDECAIASVNESLLAGELSEMGPNPVSSRASFSYSFAAMPASARVVFYNLVGDVVKEIPLEHKNGFVFIDAADFNGGIYFYTLEGDHSVLATKKMIISK